LIFFLRLPWYKDSGIEWIGEIPAHWELNKISQSFDQIGSGTTPKAGSEIYYENGTINWINTGDLNDSYLTTCKRKVTLEALQDHSLKVYPQGSIVIAMYGATIGKISILKISGCTNQACCVLNKSKIMEIRFLFYWFISRRNFIISLSYGGGQPNISQDTIRSLRIPAPSYSEQNEIADYLDQKTSHFNKIIRSIENQIEKQKELRKTLINDVVTGKIKVIDNGE
jgi:type I restriction enzyme, S subunit